MRATGIVRKIDDLGRVVLPVEIRRMLEISERDSVEIFLEGDQILIRKFEPYCIFCYSSDALQSFGGKTVCRSCQEKIKQL